MIRFKHRMIRRIHFVLIMMSLWALTADAAELTLKSGMTVRGEILEKTDDYVRIQTSFGVVIEYYHDEIAALDETVVSPPKKPWEAAAAVRATELKTPVMQEDSSESTPAFSPPVEASATAVSAERSVPLRSRAQNISDTVIPAVDVYTIIPELQDARALRQRSKEIDSGGEIDAEGYYNLGVTAAEIGEYAQAKMNFLKAINYDPVFTDAYYNLGIVCGLMRQYEEAVEYLRRALELDPEPADVYFSVGDAYAALGRYDFAERYLREARSRKADLPDIAYKLGIVAAVQERYDDAWKYLREAIDVDPLSLKAHYQLGLVAAAMGQDMAAIRSFRRTIELEPDFADAHYNLGVLLGVIGDYEKSIDAFESAVRAGTQNPDAYYNLGMAYLGQAQNSVTVDSMEAFARARRNFEKAKSFYSTSTDYDIIQQIDELLVAIP